MLKGTKQHISVYADIIIKMLMNEVLWQLCRFPLFGKENPKATFTCRNNNR